MSMRRLFLLAAIGAVLGAAAFGFQTPQRGGQGGRGVAATPATPAAPGADPYANNAAPGATQFPLAASAGKDSNSRQVAPPGAVNQGQFDPATWKYGPAFNAPEG